MNLDLAVSSIRRAVEEAETIVGVPVESALIGVAGGHVRGVNSRGGITVGARPRDVQRDDVRRAIEAARGVTLPEDREVLHVLPQEFSLDAQDNIRDAMGMVGAAPGSECAYRHRVGHGHAKHRDGRESRRSSRRRYGARAVCLGRSLPHAGRARTRLLPARYRRRHHGIDRFTGGVVRHTAAIPVGGDHFTNDLAVGLRTPIPEAEKIKREHACAFRELMPEDFAIEIASVGDRPPRTIFARMLSEIVEPRAQEFLMLVRDELRRAGLESQIPAGIVLTGGGAQLRGLVELAEQCSICRCAWLRRAGLRG